MKANLTIRQGILLLLFLFGLIIGGTLYATVCYVRNAFVIDEYHDALDDMTILGRQIETNLKSGSDDPFRFVETTAKVQEVQENFSYVLRDSSGVVVAPKFAAGKPLPISDIRYLTSDKGASMAKVWGYECFVVFYQIPHLPYDLVAVYDNKYMFEEVYSTLRLFVILICAVYLVLVLLSWFWIIPTLEKTIARKNHVENELNAARQLQQKAVTTDFPANEYFDAHAVLQPAREVGGDVYRFGMQDGKFLYVIGDVSDKGTSAALLMFTLSCYIHSRTNSDISICELMKELNRLICDNAEFEMLCTLFVGVIDPKTLEMEYCNAGHTRTMINSEFLDQDPQLLAGLDREYAYHTQKVQLHHGDRVLLYTDGVTEARAEDHSFFGEKRLQEWMAGMDPAASSEEGCRSLLDTLSAFRGDAEQNDDIAIIYVKIL